MLCVRESKSQTVRLKEEILAALAAFVEGRGGTQQQVVSVGAWFFMCMPAAMRDNLSTAFYEWCKAKSSIARIPTASPPLVLDAVAAIEVACRKEQIRFEREHGDEDARRQEITEAMLDPALDSNPVDELARGLDEAVHRAHGIEPGRRKSKPTRPPRTGKKTGS